MLLKTKNVTFVTLALSILFAAASQAAPAEPRYYSLDHLGLKSVTAVITLDSGEITIADGIGDKVLSLKLPASDSPSAEKSLLSAKELDKEKIQPATLAEARISNMGFVQFLIDRESGIVNRTKWYRRDLSPRGATTFKSRPTAGRNGTDGGLPENTVKGLYNWTVAGDHIFAYGALESGDRRDLDVGTPFKMGFLTFPLRTPNRVSDDRFLIGKVVETVKAYEYYTLGFPYVVSMGYDVYYLEMDAFPTLYHYNVREQGRPTFLNDFELGKELLPEITTGNMDVLFGTIESLDIPSGLYADEGLLYLLRRRPEAGVTSWTMIVMRPNPRGERVETLGTLTLPTSASHLTVHITSGEVFLFEKSSVRPDRTQDVENLITFPKTWLAQPKTSPLANGS